MSDKITTTTSTTESMKMTPAVKKTFSGLQQRIAELEAQLKAPHKCPSAELKTTPENYLVTGRVTIPPVGLALPKNVGFHGYVDAEVSTTENEDGEMVMPSRETVLEVLTARADRIFPGHLGVAISDVSVLPAGW